MNDQQGRQLKASCASHLWVFEQSIFFNAFCEHQAVLAVSGPVQQVLYQVLMILEDPLCSHTMRYHS